MVSAFALLVSLMVALGVGAIGGITTSKEIGGWYKTLKKPSWNPPNRVFGPVWTVLYILMAIAAWLVWGKVGLGGWTVIYFAQLGLNFLWTQLFFGRHRPDLALYEIFVLWLAILATALVFWRESPAAGALLIPYLAWVSFASVLNLSIWSLN